MQTRIRLDDITAGYDNRPQIRNVTLEVPEKGFVGITGPNGGGKTTLIRVILGLLRPMGGTVRYFRNGIGTRRIRMGYLPQYSAIDRDFPISVYETVQSGLDSDLGLFGHFSGRHHAKVAETLKRMELTDMGDRPIKALSGGELQRVLMARAIVARPEVLVLDEPDTYIDSRMKDRMHDMLNSINRECAIIMVSHDTDYIRRNAKTLVYVDETISTMI